MFLNFRSEMAQTSQDHHTYLSLQNLEQLLRSIRGENRHIGGAVGEVRG